MIKKRHPPAGARPGTLTIPEDAPKPKIRWIRFNESLIEDTIIDDPAPLEAPIEDGMIWWIDVEGFGDERLIRRLGEIFGIHMLALEDVVNVPLIPKVELYDEHFLAIFQALDMEDDELKSEQVGCVLGPNWVVSFRGEPSTLLEPIYKRLHLGKGLLRRSGADYLLYALIDLIIDSNHPLTDLFSEALDEIEDEIFQFPDQVALQPIHETRRTLSRMRRVLIPQRDAVFRMTRDESNLFLGGEVRVFLRDVYDHAVQSVEAVDASRETASGLIHLYLSLMGQRTNDVMKVLTIVTSLFVPLTFLAGIYGMNFEFMPELHHPMGYPIALGLMGLMAIGMFIFFYRKGWIGGD